MPTLTRRHLLRNGLLASTATTLGLHSRSSLASPWNRPVGLQLYSVRDLLPKDYSGTLQKIAAIGYREVEAAGFYGHSAAEVKAAMQQAGLALVSSHCSYEDLSTKLDATIDFHRAVGCTTLVCPFPTFRDPARARGMSFQQMARALTPDDLRYSAEQFNRIGERLHAAGMRFAYHNHTMAFVESNGRLPYDEMMRITDPRYVSFELDCGWAMVAGADPTVLLRRYADRITMLHIKDFKRTKLPASVAAPPPAEELGHGFIDYGPIFAAASPAHIRHYFVEQEAFNLPPMESLRIDFDSIQRLKA
jgi:sugar phosphate isomerase/epimerase